MLLSRKLITSFKEHWPWVLVGGFAGVYLARKVYVATQETNIIPKTGYSNGIDVSHYQGEIDWAQVKGAGITFAFIKATQGATNKDAFFQSNYQGATDNGIKAYPYHFYNPGDDPAAQADNFLAALPQDAKTVAIDLEESGLNWTLAPDDSDGSRFAVFLQKMSVAGLSVILYTTPAFVAKWFPDFDLSGFSRWVAKWSSTPPDDPWVFWQYSAYGQVPGIVGNVDLDYGTGA